VGEEEDGRTPLSEHLGVNGDSVGALERVDLALERFRLVAAGGIEDSYQGTADLRQKKQEGAEGQTGPDCGLAKTLVPG